MRKHGEKQQNSWSNSSDEGTKVSPLHRPASRERRRSVTRRLLGSLESLEQRQLLANDVLTAVLEPIGAPEVWIYGDQLSGNFAGAAETDTIPLNLEANQRLTLVFNPLDSSIDSQITIRDAGFNVVASATATAGDSVVFSDVSLADAGAYTVELQNTVGFGDYDIAVYLNGSIESADNDTVATATNLNSGATLLVDGAIRYAAIGNLSASDTGDFFGFDLVAGTPTSMLVSAEGTLNFSLFDTSGNQVVSSWERASGASVIAEFVPTTAGTYYVNVPNASGASQEYQLLVVQGSEISSEPNDTREEAQDIDATAQVVGAVGSGGSGTGSGQTINVAVHGSQFDYAFYVVNQLNNDTYFDFEAVYVTNDAIDTVEELNQFDVVVLGEPYITISPAAAQAILDWNTSRQGGVVSTGWLMCNVSDCGASSSTTRALLDQAVPLNMSGSRLTTSGTTTITNPTHPITANVIGSGISTSIAHDLSSAGANVDATVLATINGAPTVLVADEEVRRSVYIGIPYFWTYETTTGQADRLLEQAVAWAAASDGEDHYVFSATAGDNLAISTTTPGSDSGSPQNTLDPALVLYYESGISPESIVASNDDTSGLNSLINYTVPEGASGTYRIVVRGMSGGGPYELNVEGATPPNPTEFSVVSSDPEDSEPRSAVSTFRVQFNQPVLLSTLSADDLTIDGLPADDFAVIDGRTIEFDIASIAIADGVYSASIASGAILDASGRPLQAFTSTFALDNASPTIVAASVLNDDVVTDSSPLFTFTFNEALNIDLLSEDDFTLTELLSGNSFDTQFDFDPLNNTLSLQYEDLPQGVYVLSLSSSVNGLQDIVGNLLDGGAGPGSDSNTLFSIDTTSTIAGLVPVAPLGSRIFEGFADGAFHSLDDSDTYNITVVGDQTLSVLVVPIDEGLHLSASLSTGQTAQGNPGDSALIQTAYVASDTNFVLTVDTLSGAGRYLVRVLLNSQFEEEFVLGFSNDDASQAQDITLSAIAHPPIADRLAVVGQFDDQGIIDGQLEPNDTFGSSVITCFVGGQCSSDSYAAQIGDNSEFQDNPGLDIDLYQVEFFAGINYVIDLDAQAIGSPLDTYVRLFDSNGNEVASDDGGESSDSFLFFTPDVSGIFYIGVSSSNNSSYDPTTSGSGETFGTSNETGYYEIYISANIAETRIASDSAAGQDVYSIFLLPGEFNSFVLTSESGRGEIVLCDAEGNQVAVGVSDLNGDAFTNVDQAIVDYVSTAGGQYFIHVRGGSFENYSLVATRASTFDLENNSDAVEPQSVGNSGIALGNVGPHVPSEVGVVGTTSLTRTLTDGSGYVWQVGNYGQIDDGTSNAYDSAFFLNNFNFFTSAQTEQNGREIVVGPSLFSQTFATRSVYVPDDAAFVRYLDTFTNPTSQTVNIFPSYFANVNGLSIRGSSSGDNSVTTEDSWVAIEDGVGATRPGSVFVLGGPDFRLDQFSVNGEDVTWDYVLTLLPGETVSIMMFGAQEANDGLLEATALGMSGLLSPDFLVGLTGEQLESVVNFDLQSSDEYYFDVTEPTTVSITTATPGSGLGEPFNSLDPTIALYYMDGPNPDVPVAVAAEVGNEFLLYDVLEGATGRYRVSVIGANSRGTYSLGVSSSIAGAITDSNPFEVVSISPASGTEASSLPAEISLEFSEQVLLTSITVDDFTITGPSTVTITELIVIDGRRLTLVIDSTGAVDGEYTFAVAAGDVVSVSGVELEPLSFSYLIDGTAPTVISSTIASGDVLPSGNFSFTVEFSEPLDDQDLGASSVQLLNLLNGSQISAVSGAYNAALQTYTANFVNLPDGLFRLTLPASQFRDLVGNQLDGNADSVGGDSLSFDFATDEDSSLTDFDAVVPLGSLIYEKTSSAVSAETGDVDVFTVQLDAGQTISVLLDAALGLQARIEVYSPTATLLGTIDAASAGESVWLQPVTISQSGEFEVRVTSIAGSGPYELDVLLNASFDLEEVDGTDNGTLANSQSIDASGIPLLDSASRWGVVGTVGSELLVQVQAIGRDVAIGLPYSMAYAGEGSFYVANGDFWMLSDTGASTFVGTMNHTPFAMVMIEGTLYSGDSFSPFMYEIDRSTGSSLSSLEVRLDGLPLDGFNGLAIDPFSGQLYAIVRPSSANFDERVLVTIDMGTGVATYIGDLNDLFTGLAFDSAGRLLSITEGGSSSNRLFVIDKTSGATAEIATLTGDNIAQALSFNTDDERLYRAGGSLNFQSIGLTQVIDTADVYHLELDAGQYVSLGTASAVENIRVELLSPSGDLLAVGTQQGVNFSSNIQDFLVTATGTYDIRVYSTGGRNSYSLVVTQGIGIELEPNDDSSEAQPIGLTGAVLGSAGANVFGNDGTTGTTSLSLSLFDSGGYRWDISGSGSISDGSTDAFDGGFVLSGFGSFSTATTEQNGREVVIGPSTVSGLTTTRKVYVPTDRLFARFLDSFTNNTSSTITANIRYDTNLGSDGNETNLATSSGDLVVNTQDTWIVTDDSSVSGGDPAVAHIVGGPGFVPTTFNRPSGAVNWTYSIVVAPGETVSLLNYSVQNYNRSVAITTTQELGTGPNYALTGLSATEVSNILNWNLSGADQFTVEADPGATLTLSTTTPGDGLGEFFNDIDPIIELYYADGANPNLLVASNDNGATDGRNALLEYVVPVDAGGTYRILVRGVNSSGEFTLSVDGARASEFAATALSPADGDFLNEFPATFRVGFNQSLLATTIDASDLRVNGVPATGVALVDGQTLEFNIDGLFSADGVYTLTIAPGSLTSISGQTNPFFSSSFTSDGTSPTVVATTISDGDTVAPVDFLFQATFSESLETAGLDGSDVVLSYLTTGAQIPVDSFAYDDATRTITVTVAELEEGAYTLTLLSDTIAFRDRRGNLLDGNADGTSGDDFSIDFSVDVGTTLLPVPVSPIAPDGSLVYETSANGVISPAEDSDSFAVEVEAGQLITVIVEPLDGTLRPTVSLFGPNGVTTSGTATAAGAIAALQVFAVASAGVYSIEIAGADSTTGRYSLRVLLNASVETESLGDSSNDTLATAEALDASAIALLGTADRLAVVATGNGDDDFYSFTLTAGQYASIVTAPSAGSVQQMELLDPSGQPLAIGILSSNGETSIRSYVAATSGEYAVRVRGSTNSQYTLVVARDAEFDNEPNDDLAVPQRLVGQLPLLGGLQSTAASSSTDFSDVLGNLTLDGFVATGLWHVTAACGGELPGHSSPNFAYFGIDASCNFNAGRVAGTLTSPSLSLRAGTSPELSLKYRFDGEGGSYDRTEVRVSTDGGNTFTTVAGKSTFPSALAWTERVIDLSAYDGQTIVLQFWFDSIDSISNSGLGWQLDDIFVSGISDVFDHHAFRANAGDVLSFTTTTPGDASGQPTNLLDPRIQLYTSAGLLLAADDNSGTDGRNAELIYTVPDGIGNDFVVRITSSTANAGQYILSVQGSTADNLRAPTVTNVNPADGQAVANAPASLVLTFDEAILTSSVQAADLVFDDPNVEVTSVSFIDGRTVAFALNIPGATGDYTYTLAAGSVLDLQNIPNEAFSGLFNVDRTGPRVTSTLPLAQASAPFTSLTFVFDEFIDPASVTIADDIVSFTGPTGSNLLSTISSISINGNLLTVGFSGQNVAGPYSMRIGPNIRDLVGNVMDQNQNGTGGESNDTFLATVLLQSPDLTVSSIASNSTALFGTTIEVTYSVDNIGSDPANEGWVDAIYLSTDAILDRDDVLLKRIPSAGLLGPLDAAGGSNDSYTRTELVTLPLSITSTAGNYFVIAATDDLQRQPESSESNNSRSTTAIQLSLPPLPDLVVTDITIPEGAFSGQEVQVRWTLANQGDSPFTGSIVDQVFLSSDQVLGGDLFVGNFTFTGTIAAGSSIERTQVITLPITLEGTRYVIVRTDSTSAVFEHTGENNNVTIDNQPIVVTLSPFPNLQVSSVTPPETAFSSQSTVVEWVVTNIGDAPTSATIWYDSIYLSTDTVFDSSDQFLGLAPNVSYLNPGESYQNSLAVNMPQGISGDFYFVVVSDSSNLVYEYIRENDNVRVAERTIVQLTPPPDLQVAQVSAPAGFSGQTVAINWTVRNEGNGITLQTGWWDTVYLSTDDVLDGNDVFLGQKPHNGALLPDQEYSTTLSATLPIGIQGTYYYIVRTDAFSQVFEHVFEQNNTTAGPPGNISLTPPPDLQVTSIDAPAMAIAGRNMTVAYEVSNFGATETPNTQWRDSLYFSVDTVFDPAVDQLMSTRQRFGRLEAFDAYQASFTFAPGLNLVGNFYAFVVTDVQSEVFEVSEANNLLGDLTPIALTLLPPDLVVNSFTAPTLGQAGQSIAVSFTVENIGIGDTIVSQWRDRVWLSTDQSLGNADDILLSDIVHNGLLQPATSYSVNGQVVALPITLAAGDYYLYLRTDGANQVNESTAESNNAFGPLPITVTRQTADLQVTSVSALPTAANSEDTLAVSWQVTNAGSVPTETNYWFDNVYLSADPVLGFSQDIFLGSYQRTNVLAAGAAYDVTRSFPLPFELTGDYYVIVQTDTTSRVFEEGVEGNNAAATVDPISIALRPVADLDLTAVNAPATAFSGQAMTVEWTVTNNGQAVTNASWYDAVYLSLDQIFDRNTDTYVGFRNRPGNVAVGGSYTQSFNLTVPQGLSGPFYAFVVTDGGNAVYERGAEGNNVRYDTTPVNIELLPPADLIVGSIVIPPTTGTPGQNATITYTVNNNGSNAARGAWNDTLYISTDAQWDLSDQLFGTVNHSGDVAGGSSYTESLTAPLPGVLPGEYFVLVRSDIRNNIPESNEANNIGASLDLFDLDIAELELGTAVNTSLTTGRSIYYKLDLVAGETVRISVDSPNDNGFNDLFVRFGQFPTRGQFDYTADPPFQFDPEIILPVEQSGTYYILLYGNQVSGPQTVSVLAEVIPFSVFSVDSDVIGNRGKATVDIRGARFTDDTQFELFATVGGEEVVYPAGQVMLQDSTRAFATFELLAIPTGIYSLRAEDGSSIVTLVDSITVQESIGDDVVVIIDGPDTVRPERVVPIGLQYGNLGDQDAGAPLLVVTSSSNTPIGFSLDTMSSGPLYVLGTSPNGPLDILRPGSTGTANVLYNSGAAVDVLIEPFTPADAEVITEEQWSQIEAAIRPASLTNAQWNPYWADTQPRIGSTWGDYVGYLNRLAKELATPGQNMQDVRAMFARAFNEIPDYRPGRTMRGELLTTTGTPVVGAELALYDSQGKLASRAITNATGQYLLSFRSSDTYSLAVEAPYTWDINQDSNVDLESPTFDLENSADIVQPSLHVQRTLLDSIEQTSPVLTTDAGGTAHLLFTREGKLWHAYHNGTGWVDGEIVTDQSAYDFNLVADTQLIDGTNAGLVATWYSGQDNEAEVYYAVGRAESDGSFTWSDPVQQSTNTVQDFDPVTIMVNGQVLTVFLKRDKSVQDDSDLYFDLTSIESDEITFPTFTVALPTGDLLPQAQSAKSAQFGWEHSFGPWDFLGAQLGAKAEFNGQVTATCAPGCSLDAQANGGFGGSVTLPNGNKIEGSGNGSIKGTWKANPEGTAWDFQGASLDAGGSLSFSWDGGLTTMLGYMGPQGAAASTFIREVIDFAEWWFPSINISEGIKFTGGLAFEGLKWSSSPPFPNFLMPESVSAAKVTGSAGPYVSVQDVGGTVDVGVSGSIGVTVQVYPTFKIGPITGTIQAGAVVNGWQIGPASFSISVLNSLGGDGVFVAGEDLPFTFNPLAALGSSAVYGSNSVLANVAADLAAESSPTLAQNGDTTFVAWIADGDLGAANPEVGNRIKIADFNGTSFGASQSIPNSLGFNRHLQTSFDANANRVAVWSMASADGLGGDTTAEELKAAMRATDIVVSVFDGTTWSSPVVTAATPGTDAAVSLASTAEGDLLLSWSTFDETNGYRLLAQRWNATTMSFGAVETLATGNEINDVEVGIVNGKTTVFWSEDVDPAADTSLRNIFFTTFDGGVWQSVTEFEPGISTTGIMSSGNLYSENLISSLPSLPSAMASIAESLKGDIVAAWAEGNAANEETTVGYVKAAVYRNGTWTSSVAIPESTGVIREVTAATNVKGELFVLWIAQQADGTSDLLSSIYSRDGWSKPVKVASGAGSASQLRIGMDGLSGELLATWVENGRSGSQRLLSTRWSDGWSNAEVLQSGASISNDSIRLVDGNTVATWTVLGQTMSSRLQNSSWSTAALATQQQLAAAALAMHDMFLLPSIVASMQTSGLHTFAGSFQLLPVPEDCKKCDRVEEIRSGSGDCGYKVEFDEENCKRITYYRPCVVRPSDPNDILGPIGFGDANWISAATKLDYTIRFENQPSATAPAQEVVITQVLDPDLNPAKFRLGEFGFRNMTFDAPNKPFHFQSIDLTEEYGIVVNLTALIDIASGTATWTFRTIDPATGQPPLDASLGFLPINDETGVGEGFVSYVIEADAGVPTGTVIDAEARIVFDTEEPIDTPPIFHTLDAEAPGSTVVLLTSEESNEFLLNWSGADPNEGSGIALYDVYVSINNDGYIKWLANTELTEALYVGEPGNTYEFYSSAVDNANNVEAEPSLADVVVIIPGEFASIGDRVWNDLDFNGLQDESEPGIEGVTVSLFIDDGSDGQFVTSTTTDESGNYSFVELATDVSYFLAFSNVPSGFAFTDANQGGDDAIDSDAAVATGLTVIFAVVGGENFGWDAGVVALGSIAGVVWNDLNGDASRQIEEPGLEGWTVYLDINDNGELDVGEPAQPTNALGEYAFGDLRPGTYVVSEVIPEDWMQTYPGETGAASATGSRSVSYVYTGNNRQLTSPGFETDAATTTPATDLIGLNDFRSDSRYQSVRGDGYTVVVIDTGIDLNHSFFGPDNDRNGIADRIVYQYDFADRDNDASDYAGHGSHVTSIIASEDTRYPGIAPDANIIHLKVFSDTGYGYFSYVEQALAWVIQNVDTYNIAAVNLSIGDGLNWTNSRGIYGLGDELAALAAQDVIAVAAAGNAYGLYRSEGLSYPAADPNTISVGAVWDSNRGGPWTFGTAGADYLTGADHITSFTQRSGQLLDVMAPGAVITAANARGGVSSMRGTSMATPFITGAAVLAQELANQHLGRSLTLAEFRYLINSSGVTVVDGDNEQDNVPNTSASFRRLDLVAFANQIMAYDGKGIDSDDSNNQDGAGGPIGPAGGRPFSWTIELSPGEHRVDVNFGNKLIDSIGPEVTSISEVSPDPRRTPISTIDVTFSEDIDPATFDVNDLLLKRGAITIPLDARITTSLVSGTTYRISGLNFFTSVQGPYQLTLNAAGIEDLAGNDGLNSLTESWTVDTTRPTSRVNALAAVQPSGTFTVSVSGADAVSGGVSSGVASYEIYRSIDGSPWQLWTTVPASAPNATYTATSFQSIGFYSIAIDTAGNREAKIAAVEAGTFVPDLLAPATQVTAVDSSSSTFVIDFSGSDTGGAVLSTFQVYVSIDGGVPALISTVSAGTADGTGVYNRTLNYSALADGTEHTYRFFTLGTDSAGNVESAPNAPLDVEVTATFEAPADLYVRSFNVQRGAVQRSYVRYIDVTFSIPDPLQTMVETLSDADASNDRIRLTRKGLDGNGESPVSINSLVSANGPQLNFDFGANGIGGNRNSNVGDGYYVLQFDLDGNGNFTDPNEQVYFYRLLGNVTSDQAVTQDDITAITNALGTTGVNLEQDANGDGSVNQVDRILATQALGRSLGAGQPLTPPTPLTITGFDVQKGMDQRSYVRFVDVSLSHADLLSELVQSLNDSDTSNDRVMLERLALDGSGPAVPVSLSGSAVAVDHVMSLDFGAQGLGGDRNSASGNGYYRLKIDLDGDGDFDEFDGERTFYRLLGDATGDGVVDPLDLNFVQQNLGLQGTAIEPDINGSGLVDNIDRVIAARENGKRLGNGLPLSD